VFGQLMVLDGAARRQVSQARSLEGQVTQKGIAGFFAIGLVRFHRAGDSHALTWLPSSSGASRRVATSCERASRGSAPP
jgi:hypothetical protein